MSDGVENRGSNGSDNKVRDIKVVYECIRQMLSLDTDLVIEELDIMKEVNDAIITRYRDLNSYSEEMYQYSNEYNNKNLSLDTNTLQLIENRVDKLLLTVEEMEEWSHEMEVKFNRVRN